MTAYAELHALSNFSFLRGASHPEELVARAAELGYTALALTDECSLAGVVRAHVAAREHDVRLIIGSELRLEDGTELVLLVTSRVGYAALGGLITRARRRAGKGRYRLGREDLEQGLADCLALWLPGPSADPEAGRWLMGHFAGRCWLAVELLGGVDDRRRLAGLRALGQELGMPLLAAGEVHMHRRGRRALQDTLTAIRLGRTLAEAGLDLHANGERHLRPRRRLARIYPAALLDETVAVARRCRFSLDELHYTYPRELVPGGVSAADHLRRLTEQGMARRWPAGVPETVWAQVAHELGLIRELDYEPYFLTVHDIVAYARGRGILCQGRGSAANSAVCYCLAITEVDPARMSMLFERFISRERNEPPDIDVDFEHERREEVIQYIYRRYGRERAALAASVIRYRPRSAVRDVARVLGLSAEQIERLARSLYWWDGVGIRADQLRELGFEPEAPVMRRLAGLVSQLVGFPRHLSQHVGGFVISDGPLSDLVPIENAAMPERTVIQWDKDDLEALGLLKVDVLALGMLSAIRKALALVGDGRGGALAMQDIPAEDPRVYDMLCRADSIGVFQVESRAQMAMLPRLRPRRFYDLVIEVAIVRPGPIQGGMVHPYLRRRSGQEPVRYPSEAVRGVLQRTLGVPIFQEQAMRLAVVAAGFTPGEADQLRRAMAAWRRRGGLAPFEDRLIGGMRERGYDEAFARQVYEQIKGFGDYGFPESHSASFALLVYVSAWLKCHHPAAFACALLNSQPMGFYAPAQLLRDAREHGVQVRPVAVNHSDWDCGLERDGPSPVLRLGLRLVKGLARDTAQRISQACADVPFGDVAALRRRAGLGRRELESLAAAGALAGLAGNRHQARWQVAGSDHPGGLLDEAPVREAQPLLPAPGEGRDLLADYAALGLSLGRHPLALLRPRLTRMQMLAADEINASPQGRAVQAAGLVINRQRPLTASGVIFMTLEDETGIINLVVWPRLAERQRRVALGARLLGVQGVVEREGQVVHLVAGRLFDHSALIGELLVPSRDFH